MDAVISPNQPAWIDSHCHIHDERIPDGPDGAVAAAMEMGVHTLVTVGCDRATSEAAIAVASRHDNVFATVGLHPHDAVQGVHTIVDLLDTPGIVAIGEAGLDYYYEHSERDIQKAAFAEQVHLAHEYKLPLVIHCRDAWDDTFDILDAEGVLHRRPCRGSTRARARHRALLLRHRHFQECSRGASSGAAVPTRFAACRNRQPLSGTAPAPGKDKSPGLGAACGSVHRRSPPASGR
jgi:hypothetical protein